MIAIVYTGLSTSMYVLYGKGQTISKAKYGVLNSPKKRKNPTVLSKEETQDSEFCSFLVRIE